MIYGGLALFPTPAYGHFFNYSFEKTLDKNISPKNVCVPRKNANNIQGNFQSCLM